MLIDEQLLDEVTAKAKASERLKMNQCTTTIQLSAKIFRVISIIIKNKLLFLCLQP